MPLVPRRFMPGQDAGAVFEAVRAYLEQVENQTAVAGRVLETQISDARPVPGDIVPCDLSAGAFTVWLPEIKRKHIGAVVHVVEVGGSTNTLTVRPVAGGTIAGSATYSMTTANLMRKFIAITTTKWGVM